MSQLNQSKLKKAYSFEGNLQKEKSLEQQLYEIVSMTLLSKDSFYETNDERFNRLYKIITKLVEQNKIVFVQNLIVHARTNLHIRSMPIVLLVTLAYILKSQNKPLTNIKHVVYNTIQRVDEITDLMAYAKTVFGCVRNIPSAILYGTRSSFNKFDEYQFAKYYRKRKEFSIKDVLIITKPKPISDEQSQLFKKILENDLKIPYTWETELSKNDGIPKKDKWEQLIDSNKMGYMATLRNLRNFIECDISTNHTNKVCDYISNEIAVKNSKQFPYRFLSAMNSISNNSNHKFNQAITKAADISLSNIPDLGDNIWVIVDCSLSMNNGWNYKDNISPFKKASLFAAAIAKKHAHCDNFKLTMFSDSAGHVNYNPDSLLFDIVNKMKSEMYGGGTNLNSALNLKDSLGFKPKVIVLFSDMQVTSLSGYNKEWLKSNDMIKIAVNLEAYNSTPANENDNWLQVSGYSDSIFNYIQIKQSENSIINKLTNELLNLEMIKEI